MAPRISTAKTIHVTLIADVSSVELFADDGLSVMTEIYFPSQPFNKIQLQSTNSAEVNNLIYTGYKSIWK